MLDGFVELPSRFRPVCNTTVGLPGSNRKYSIRYGFLVRIGDVGFGLRNVDLVRLRIVGDYAYMMKLARSIVSVCSSVSHLL